MKLYFFLCMTFGVISCIYAMDNNNNNNRTLTKEELVKKINEEVEKKTQKEDLESEKKARAVLTQLYQCGIASGIFTPENQSTFATQQKMPSQNSNQQSVTFIHSSQNQNQPTMITTYTKFSVQAIQNPQNTNSSSPTSSPTVSRLAEGLKNSTLNSPAVVKKSSPAQSFQTNNNNTDDESDGEQDPECNQAMMDKVFENSNRVKGGEKSPEIVEGAIKEYLTALKIVRGQQLIDDDKEEKKAIEFLQKWESEKQNDDNNNNKK